MRPLVPPPIQAIAALLLIWGASRVFPEWNLEFGGQLLLAGLLAGCGVVIDVVAVRAFRQKATTVNPLKPESSTALVESGPFRYSRNPMYLGMLLILLGFAVWRGNPLGLVAIILFVLSITVTQILPEERAMRELFGSDYERYCATVRRWI